jgi:opacity protein-like surface antigen
MPRTLVPATLALAVLIAVPAQAAQTARPSGTIVISDAGADVTVKCRAGKRNVRVLGAAAKVRVNGRCREISVSGAGSAVRAGIVDRIRVSGSYARVSYRSNSSGGKASVRVSGVGARVTRRG